MLCFNRYATNGNRVLIPPAIQITIEITIPDSEHLLELICYVLTLCFKFYVTNGNSVFIRPAIQYYITQLY